MKITKSGYDLKFVQRNKINNDLNHLFCFIYTFHSSHTRLKYVVNADYHKGDFFAVKFYAQKDSKSNYKYNKLINRGNAVNILLTCAKVIPLLLQEYPKASFGFIGSRTFDEKSKRLEEYDRNQRFRIYSRLVSSLIGNKTFEHFEYPQISGYLLVNKKFRDVSKKERRYVLLISLCS